MNQQDAAAPATARSDAAEFHQPLGPVSMGLIMLTAALWGGTPVAVKYSVDVLPPIAVSGIRFALAAAFMLVWCRLEGSGIRLRRGQYVPSLIAGLLLFAQIALFTVAIQLSTASHSTLLINTFVFWVMLIDHFVTRHDRLGPRKLLGLAVAASGVLVVVTMTDSNTGGMDEPSLTGDLLMLASAVVLAVKIVYTKRATQSVEPGKLIFWHDVIGVVLFTLWSAAFEEVHWNRVGVPATLGLLYQGLVVAGFCFAMQTHLLQKHSAAQLSVFSFATPVCGVTLAILFRGDPLSSWLLLAAALVATGIWLVTTARRGEAEG